MIADTEYATLLKRARDTIPEIVSDHQRFPIPEADVIYEGKITIIRTSRTSAMSSRGPATISWPTFSRNSEPRAPWTVGGSS